jgi:5-methylcytosine-specific restriction protein B
MIENRGDEKTIFNSISDNKDTKDFNYLEYEKAKNEERIDFVTFHQSYSYEDFIEGFRPSDENKIVRKDGIFKSLSNKAIKNLSQNFYIVIDEINRGNISKIFGELITLIEESKRDNYEVTLPYSKEKFKVPSNLYIIATMNSTDKSIATIDIALRRRFTFLKMLPNPNLVTNMESQIFMRKANQYISRELSEDYQLGHSYFMGDDVDLEFIKDYKIKPLLEEYFYVEDKDVETILTEIEKENLKDEQ